jgi:Holliday junction resolvase RusA-like endonuclease
MPSIEIYIPGTPVAQSRPRFARRGKFTTTYDAAPARDYKSWVRSCALEKMRELGMQPFHRDIPLFIDVQIGLARPKSKPKRFVLPTSKPDNDNFLKGVQDALESICYQADQQIVTSHVKKRYTEQPGVVVRIGEERE